MSRTTQRRPRHPAAMPSGLRADGAVLLWFAGTLLLSAALLFIVEPMFAKKALPLLGGTPAVWNTCLVFYQTLLLVGYLYAHVTTQWLGARRQAVLHIAILLAAWLVLPIASAGNWVPPAASNPIPWLLGLLTASIGLPFFVISASAPMLQAWFVETGHARAKDPYFLYAASNLGSMAGLLGYPFLIEPLVGLSEQARLWTVGYAVLSAMTAGCAIVLWRRSPASLDAPTAFAGKAQAAEGAAQGHPTRAQRMRWVLLAFVPSSLLLGVTSHISTDIAVVPLLWVIPLALYLLSFVIVFSRRPLLSHRWMIAVQPLLLLVAAAFYYHSESTGFWFKVLLHLATFFVTAMVCHGELAQSRPAARHLTEFYIWMSVGGMLGGWFNALVAPVVLPLVLEYPLMLVVACLLRPSVGQPAVGRWTRRLDYFLPLAVAAGFFGVIFNLVLAVNHMPMSEGLRALLSWAVTVIFLIAIGVCLLFLKRPVRFGLGVAGMLAVSWATFPSYSVICQLPQRNFFGVLRVKYHPGFNAFTLFNGTTNHGMQSREENLWQEPISYFYRSGPLGEVFDAVSQLRPPRRVGVVGLGIGTMACYGEPGQRWTFYEINPLVLEIAKDPAFFTYLSNSKADTNVVLGDARLSLEKVPDGEFDVLCLDAFSSDRIPIHLTTREAIRLYWRKLKEHGVLAIHISNNYLDLAKPLGNIAAAEGLQCRARQSDELSEEEQRQGKMPNTWLVMTRRPDDLGKLAANPKWRPCRADLGGPLWTDDFSDILSVMIFTW